MARPTLGIETRLTRRRLITKSGCWIWTGAKRNKYNYGGICFNGKTTGVHRVSYELFVGSIPRGALVLHRCDVPSCFNPDHLFLGTHKDNVMDAIKKRRHVAVRGERHYKSKLTNKMVKKIRGLFMGGEKPRVLAGMFGVSRSAIRFVVERKTWRHVK